MGFSCCYAHRSPTRCLTREVTRIGKAFCCPLPGHEERKPSAALWQRPGEPIMLIDFHMRPQQPDSAEYAAANPDIDQEAVTAPQMHWMLPDVYAACKTGKAPGRLKDFACLSNGVGNQSIGSATPLSAPPPCCRRRLCRRWPIVRRVSALAMLL